jgi:hypothetical protein
MSISDQISDLVCHSDFLTENPEIATHLLYSLLKNSFSQVKSILTVFSEYNITSFTDFQAIFDNSLVPKWSSPTYHTRLGHSKKIIYSSCVRSATDPSTANLRVDCPEREMHPASSPIMTHSGIGVSSAPTNTKLHTFDPSDLVGRTFLMPKDENGERLRSRITKVVKQIDKDDLDKPAKILFLLKCDKTAAKELITYNEVLEHLERSELEEGDQFWSVNEIIGH